MNKEQQNGAAIDPWTLVHMASGLAMGLMRLPLAPSIAAAIAYEAVEQIIERSERGQDFFATSQPETLSNAIVDVLVLIAGHRLGVAWNRTGS